MSNDAGTACHWRPIFGTPPLDIKEKKTSWKGFTAFRIASVEENGSVRLYSRNQEIIVNDDNKSPAVLHPAWWGSLVQDEAGMDMPASTWCSSLREAIDEAAFSTYRGIDRRHEVWEDYWWMIWELTLWDDTVTGMVSMNSISPGAITPIGPTR